MKQQISLTGEDRIKWNQLRNRAYVAVNKAVKEGKLKNLKTEYVKCVECGHRAEMYDHRDYNKPLQVEPICNACNVSRGTIAPLLPQDKSAIRCKICSSSNVYTTLTQKVCRKCGHREPITEIKEG